MARRFTIKEYLAWRYGPALKIAGVLMIVGFLVNVLGPGGKDDESSRAETPTAANVVARSAPLDGTEAVCHGARLSVVEREVASEDGYDIHPTLGCITKASHDAKHRTPE